MKNPKQRNSNQKELDCIGNIQIISEYQDDKETGFSNDFQKDTCNTLELTKQNNDEEKSMEAYFMTIEIDKTHSKTLKIFNHIPPEEIAFQFCKANNLDNASIDYLVKEIKKINEKQKMMIKNDLEMNINFSETIHEVDEEELISDLNRKESLDNTYHILTENIPINKVENYHNEKEYSTTSKLLYNLNNFTQSDNGIQNINKAKNERILYDKLKLGNKKSNSETIFSYVKKEREKLSNNRKINLNKSNLSVNNQLELNNERIKRLLNTKEKINCKPRLNSSLPNYYDFSKLKKRILNKSTFLNINSTQYKKKNNLFLNIYKNDLKDKSRFHSFSPKINKNLQNFIKEKKKISSDESFKLAKKRPSCLFVDIDDNKFHSLRNKTQTVYLTLEERQKAFSKKVDEKRRKLENDLQNFYATFSKNRKFTVSDQKSHIFNDKINSRAKVMIKSTEKQKIDYKNDKIMKNGILSNYHCKSIIDSQKKEAFKKMFLILDSNGNNVISNKSVNLSKIPEKVKKMISPILSMMLNNNICFKEDSFIKECFNTFQSFNYNLQKTFITFTKSVILPTKFDPNVKTKSRLYSSKTSESYTQRGISTALLTSRLHKIVK